MRGATLAGAGAVWLRQFLVWRNLIWSSLATNILNPLLFLFAFGFGLGAVIARQGGIDYLAFVLPGMACYSAMFVASFETTVSAFARFSLQRTWDAMLATPITLDELLLGEALWAATKAMLTIVCVFAVGLAWGAVPSPLGALVAMPILFLAALGFACQGLLCTAYAKGFDAFSYFFTFWTTPMFLFSGVFFDLSRFPSLVRGLAWLLPMPHVLALVRPLSTGSGVEMLPAVGHLLYLTLFFVVPLGLARHRVGRRMFD